MIFTLYVWNIFTFEINNKSEDKIIIFKDTKDTIYVNNGNADTQTMISITPEWIDKHNKTNPTKPFKITIETKPNTSHHIAFKTISEYVFITEEKGYKGDINSAIDQILNNNNLNISGLIILKNTIPPEYIFKTRAEKAKEAKTKEAKTKEKASLTNKQTVVLRQSPSTTTNKPRPNSYTDGEKKEETKTFLQRVDSKQNVTSITKERSNSTNTTTNLKNSDGTHVTGYLQPTRASTSKLSQLTTNLSGNANLPTKRQSKTTKSKTDARKPRQTKASRSAAATNQLQTKNENPRSIKGGRKAESVIKQVNEEELTNGATDQITIKTPDQSTNKTPDQSTSKTPEHSQSSQYLDESISDDQSFVWEDDLSTLNIQIYSGKDSFTQYRSIERYKSDESLDGLDNHPLFLDSFNETQTPNISEEITSHYTPRVPPLSVSHYSIYYPSDIDVSDEDIERLNLEEITEPDVVTGSEPEIVTHTEPKDEQEHTIVTDKIITEKDGNIIFVLDKTITYEFQTNALKESNGYVDKIKTTENKAQTFIDLISNIKSDKSDDKLMEMFDEIFTSNEIAKDIEDIFNNNLFINSDAYQTYETFINDAHKYRAYRKYVNKELFIRVLNYDYVVYTEIFDEFYSYIKGREDLQSIIEDIKNSDTKTDITKYMTPGEMIEDYHIFMENSCIDKIKKHRESKRITLKELTENDYKYNFIKHLIIDGYQIDINALNTNTNIKNKQLLENILTVMKNKTIEVSDQIFEDISKTPNIDSYDILEKVYDFHLVFSIYEEKAKVMEEFKNQLGTEKEIKDFNKYLNQKKIDHNALEYVELGNNRIFDIAAMEEELHKILGDGEEDEEELIVDFIQRHFDMFVKIVEEQEEGEQKEEQKEEQEEQDTSHQNLSTPKQNPNILQQTSNTPQSSNLTPNNETDSSENEPKNDSTATETSLIQENDYNSKRKMSKGMFIFLIVNAVIASIGLIVMVGVLIYRYKKRKALKALEHENNDYDLKELFEDNIDVTFE